MNQQVTARLDTGEVIALACCLADRDVEEAAVRGSLTTLYSVKRRLESPLFRDRPNFSNAR
jgi:hypothetical protein